MRVTHRSTLPVVRIPPVIRATPVSKLERKFFGLPAAPIPVSLRVRRNEYFGKKESTRRSQGFQTSVSD